MNDYGSPSAFSILAGIVGEHKAQEVCKLLGGEQVYIPHRPRPQYDPQELREAFEAVIGRSESVTSAYETVAESHSVSIRTVQRALQTRDSSH